MTTTEKKTNPALMKPMRHLLNSPRSWEEPLPCTEITKRIWAYIGSAICKILLTNARSLPTTRPHQRGQRKHQNREELHGISFLKTTAKV